MRPEHRLHAGAARRAAAADGDGRAGLSATTGSGSRRRASTRRWCATCRASSRRRSSAAPTPTTTRSRLSTRARWRTRASCRSARSAAATLAIISPNDPAAMLQYAEECRTLGIPFIFDPGQQCARMSGPELRDGLSGAAHRHLQRLRARADPAEDRARASTSHPAAGRDAGRHARRARLHDPDVSRTRRRARRRTARIVDPTGVGDAFRGGFMKGMALEAEPGNVRPAGQRRRDLRPRAPRRHEPRVHVGGVRRPV